MATTRKASIAAELRADRAKFKQDLDGAKKDIKAFGDDARKAGGSFAPGAGAFAGLKRNWTEINSRATAAKNVVEEVYGAVNKPMVANAWYEDLQDRLTAVMGSADAAKKHLGSLRLISDEQSMSDDQFEKIVDYSERLQSLGYSAEQASDFIREMANSAEGMGRGVEAFEPMVGSLDKINQKAESSLKTIMQMSESMPAVRRALEAGFGTSNAKALEDMNLTNGELSAGLLRGLRSQDTATPSQNEVTLAQETRKKQWLGADSADNNGTLAERQQLTEEQLAEARKKLADDIAARDQKAAAEKTAAGMKELERQEQLLDTQKQLAEAEIKGDKDKIQLWEDRLAIMEKAADLARELGISEEAAADAIRRQNAIRRETAALAESVRTPEQQAGMATTREQMEIDRLRSRGKNKEADKRQKALDLASETDRLKAEGFSPEDAAAMAAQSQRTQEDQAYFDKTGRRKMHGAESQNLNPRRFHDSQSLDPNYRPFEPDGSMAYDFSQKKTPLNNALASVSKAAALAVKDPNVSGADAAALRDLKDALVEKLDQLISANTGTVAEKTRPQNR